LLGCSSGLVARPMHPLILKCGTALRRLWRWRHDKDGIVIFLSPDAPKHRPWMWIARTQGPPACLWLRADARGCDGSVR